MSNYLIYIPYLANLLVSFSLFHPWSSCDVAALSIQCSHASCGGAKFKTGCRERLFCFFPPWSQAVSTRKMCNGRKFAENMKHFLFLDSRCLLVCYSRLLFWINMLPSMDYMAACLNFCIKNVHFQSIKKPSPQAEILQSVHLESKRVAVLVPGRQTPRPSSHASCMFKTTQLCSWAICPEKNSEQARSIMEKRAQGRRGCIVHLKRYLTSG